MVAAERAAAKAKALEARKLAMREAAKAKAEAARNEFLASKGKKERWCRPRPSRRRSR